MEIPPNIESYDRDNVPDPALAWQMAEFFAANYPDMHDPLERAQDLEKHGSVDAILERLREEYFILIQRGFQGRIAGLLEWKPIRVEGIIYAELTWLMTDSALRGQGVGRSLHDVFVEQATQIKQGVTEPVALRLSVHKNNTARTFLRKIGYTQWSQSPTNHKKIFMGREL